MPAARGSDESKGRVASFSARENRRLEEDVEICTPSARELSDNELTEKTIAIFEESDGT